MNGPGGVDARHSIEPPEVGPRDGVPGVSSPPAWRVAMARDDPARFGEAGREPAGLILG